MDKDNNNSEDLHAIQEEVEDYIQTFDKDHIKFLNSLSEDER